MAVNDDNESSHMARSGNKSSSPIAAKQDSHGHLRSARFSESWFLPCG